MEQKKVHVGVKGVMVVAGLIASVHQSTLPSRAEGPAGVKVGVHPKATPGPIAQVQQGTNKAKSPSASGQSGNTKKSQVVDANVLLGNMRASLAMISADLADPKSKAKRSQSSGLLAKATQEVAAAVAELDKALKAKNSKQISSATRKLSLAMGRLETTYALTNVRTDRSKKAVQSCSSNWSAYSARYALKETKKTKPKSGELAALRKKTAEMSARLAQLERETAGNSAVRSEISRLRRELEWRDARQSEAEAYQSLLLTLAVVTGSFDGLFITTSVYYPTYYAYLKPYRVEYSRSYIDGYWDGFYDAYYTDAGYVWYGEDFVVSAQIDLLPTVEINEYRNVTYQEIYNINVVTTEATSKLPADNLEAVAVEPVPGEVFEEAPAAIEEISEEPSVPENPIKDDEAQKNDGAGNVASPQTEPAPEQPTPEESTPEQPAPEKAAPEQPAPEKAAPEQPAPEEAAPEQPAPEETAPEQPAPEKAAPEQPAPEEAAPEQPAPEEAEPEQPAPEEAAPEQSAPEEAAPEQPAPEEAEPEQPSGE
ncbi:MAG: hypothetical protein WBP38_04360 [Hyphomicrobium sp.]